METLKIEKAKQEINNILDNLKLETLNTQHETLYNVCTFAEAAEMLGISKSYVNKLADTGILVEDVDYRKAKGTRLILKSTVDKLLNNKKNKGTFI